MYGEQALWLYKRGVALGGLGRSSDAERDLRKSLASEGRKWVHGRAHLELGRLALKASQKTLATQELQTAIQLCDSDNDSAMANEARRLLK